MNKNDICADNEHESRIADVYDENESWRANARLIAAAPELLAACKRAVAAFNELPLKNLKDGSTTYDIAAALGKLIRKAASSLPGFIGDYKTGMVTPSNLTILANCRRMKDAEAIAKENGGRVVPYLHGYYKRGWVVTTLPNCSA